MNPVSDTLATAAAAESGLHVRAEHILLPGLGLGLAGDYLLRNGPLGPGLVVWLALLTAAALWLTRAAGQTRQRTLATWSATALVAALFTVLRDLEAIIPMMLFVILVCAVLTALETGGIALRAARVRDYFLAGFSFPLQMLTWTPRLLKQADLSSVTRNPKLPGVVRGIMIAVPVLLVFGALFASADAGFTRYASALTDIISPELLQHLLLVLVFGWLGTSLLGVGCRKAATTQNSEVTAPKLGVGTTETHVVLALVSALFVAFVVLQLGYLFGGNDTIVNTSGLTIADYARRGFFELVVVAALTLGLLLVLDATDCERHVLRRYGTVLIACVLVILASALQRLFLYTDAFGMTIERFSALAVMLWQAFNLVSFALTVLRGRIAGFASALVISGIASLFLLALVNPGAVVARINLERAVEDSRPLDVDYLMVLRADAVPAIMDNFDALPATQQCEIARGLLARYPIALDGTPLARHAGYDWRSWNAAWTSAAKAVGARADALYDAAGVMRTEGPLLLSPSLPPC
jgi:hypothetical protein